MKVASNGKTIKLFMNDEKYWGPRFIEEALYTVNGKEVDSIQTEPEGSPNTVKDDDVVVITYGYVCDEDVSEDYPKFFKRWLDAQQVNHLLISVPKDKDEAVRKALAELGVEILEKPESE